MKKRSAELNSARMPSAWNGGTEHCWRSATDLLPLVFPKSCDFAWRFTCGAVVRLLVIKCQFLAISACSLLWGIEEVFVAFLELIGSIPKIKRRERRVDSCPQVPTPIGLPEQFPTNTPDGLIERRSAILVDGTCFWQEPWRFTCRRPTSATYSIVLLRYRP